MLRKFVFVSQVHRRREAAGRGEGRGGKNCNRKRGKREKYRRHINWCSKRMWGLRSLWENELLGTSGVQEEGGKARGGGVGCHWGNVGSVGAYEGILRSLLGLVGRPKEQLEIP